MRWGLLDVYGVLMACLATVSVGYAIGITLLVAAEFVAKYLVISSL